MRNLLIVAFACFLSCCTGGKKEATEERKPVPLMVTAEPETDNPEISMSIPKVPLTFEDMLLPDTGIIDTSDYVTIDTITSEYFTPKTFGVDTVIWNGTETEITTKIILSNRRFVRRPCYYPDSTVLHYINDVVGVVRMRKLVDNSIDSIVIGRKIFDLYSPGGTDLDRFMIHAIRLIRHSSDTLVFEVPVYMPDTDCGSDWHYKLCSNGKVEIWEKVYNLDAEPGVPNSEIIAIFSVDTIPDEFSVREGRFKTIKIETGE